MSLAVAWDQFDAYLFDIDGTLLHCTDAVHYFAFCDALSTVAGRQLNLDGVTAHGNTDIGILRDALTLAGVSPQEWRPRLPELCDAMCCQVERQKADLCITTLPQVREVLHHLHENGALLCVATGNLERIGKQKLAAAKLLELFPLGAWSDGLEYREHVFRHGIALIRERLSNNAAILAFGDTPADISAARANNLPIAAVATGIYAYETLAAESPSLCIRSFADLLE
ncbi:HAD family hydrolase [Occallatibacter riparius]|uniref:phosphoglycolate phosphatase n=1 Tax=Occallatibacter riparius TaxID=1002689 RepID=A0A9J7BZ99_9BACT|nr:HAD family hydrolase [Occallatibacter riparius]UWZ86950.1 HAD hydrolase-like protein [Occallatibacter riparius]